MQKIGLVAAITIAIGSSLFAAPATSHGQTAKAESSSTQILQTLNGLQVKGRAPKDGYDRGLFGQAWSDDVTVEYGHNGCDTRNDILGRDLTSKTFKQGTRDCVVLSGELHDRYTGRDIAFKRGTETSSKVQIDHVVALVDAWQKGAQSWTTATRRNFANDPLNLRAVDGPANQQKGGGDAATWLPANRGFRCAYVTTQVRVKSKYKLWVTSAEKDAMKRILSNCEYGANPQQKPAPNAERSPAPKPKPKPKSAPERPQSQSSYFANCSEARAAGAAPIYRGQPGYRSALDRDDDGVACE